MAEEHPEQARAVRARLRDRLIAYFARGLAICDFVGMIAGSDTWSAHIAACAVSFKRLCNRAT